MLVLQASEEQEQIFQKLIQTMGEQVVWNGRFIVRDDELILEGTVRSLIFQFETKKVYTNLVELSYKEEEIYNLNRHPTLKDLVHMVLYAFGKWGMLRGLNVQQDYPQLNQLFAKILNTFYIEPSFRKENFRFYKVGVRVTYEEVLQTVLEYEKKQAQDPLAESQGLWHRLIWKNRERAFHKEETTLLERVEDRIGNNFYLVGYQCPQCQNKLHMAVYPEGKEVRIDTEEKGVYLARVYTCSHCQCFYTPRPDHLISEGLIYEMDFGEDSKAYEDYLELMGYYGERAANFHYNEYEAVRAQRLQDEKRKAAHPSDTDHLSGPQDALRQIEQFSRHAASLPKDVFERFAHRVEEGFYPDAAVAKHEAAILKEAKDRENRAYAGEEPGRNDGAESADARNKAAGNETGRRDPAGNGITKKEAAGGAGRYQTSGRYQPGTDRMKKNLTRAGQAQNLSDLELDELGQAQNLSGLELDGLGQAQNLSDLELDGLGQAQILPPDHLGQARNLAQKGRGYGTDPVQNDRTQMQNLTQNQAENSRNPAQNLTGNDRNPAQWQHTTVHSTEPPSASGFQTDSVMKNPAVRHKTPDQKPDHPAQGRTASDQTAEHLESYEKRILKLDRLSKRQRTELKKQIQGDNQISAEKKRQLESRIEEAEYQDLAGELHKKAEQSEKKSYAQLVKTIQETEQAEYPQSVRGPYLEKLKQLRDQRGREEVQKIIGQMPERMDRSAFQKLEQRLAAYTDVDLSPYEQTLQQKREAAEKNEIAGMVRHSRKVSRGDYTGLMRRLEEQGFSDENVAPYMEKIKEKVTQLDKDRLDDLLDQAQQMDFNAAAAVYEQITDENFLPELKNSALEMLARRLEKIRTDECELLVRKLQDEMQGTIKDNARHHFYPARKVMLHTAEPKETVAIDAALASYANGRSMFEYPVFSVDTSRNSNGREGMLLTPETLFYSTRTRAYEVPVSDIASIEASTGLLNRKITLTETDGTEHKLPYAVKTGEMEDWAGILEQFIFYLQEKPASRKLKYLAKETHDTICCYRCGYVYHDRDVCPECGYKKNR